MIFFASQTISSVNQCHRCNPQLLEAEAAPSRRWRVAQSVQSSTGSSGRRSKTCGRPCKADNAPAETYHDA